MAGQLHLRTARKPERTGVMNGARGLLAAIIFLGLTCPLNAQLAVAGRGGIVGGLAYDKGGRLSLSISAGYGLGYGYGCGFGPVGYPGCFPGYCPPLFRTPPVTIINVSPPPPPPQPQVFMPPMVEPAIPFRFDTLADLDRQQLPPVVDRAPPGEQVGGYRPVPPGNREQARQPARPEPQQEEPKPKPQETNPPAPKPGQLPPPPMPDLDPKVESAHQLALGQEAFALGQYGRAAQRFRMAITLAPEQPLGHFLLGQALFALAKYDEAADAIFQGLRRQPDWPTMGFRPIRLYEGSVADYPEHLRRLEAVLDQNPDDPVLLFLYAYQLWFDGRQEEALPLFQKAAPRLPDRQAAERFLQHRPPGVPMV